MRLVERALTPLLAVVAFVVLLLLRSSSGAVNYAPRESELAALLADLGQVRAWSGIVGDHGEPPLPWTDDGWDAVSHYLLTAPDGYTSLLTVAHRTFASRSAAGASFDRSVGQLGASGVIVHQPTTYAGHVDAEQRRDFRQPHTSWGGQHTEAQLRLLREGAAVVLVRLVPGSTASNRGAQLAFERTAGWEVSKLLAASTAAIKNHD